MFSLCTFLYAGFPELHEGINSKKRNPNWCVSIYYDRNMLNHEIFKSITVK